MKIQGTRIADQEHKINEQDILNHEVIDAKKLRGRIFFVETFPMTPSDNKVQVFQQSSTRKLNFELNIVTIIISM